jgi:WD repeat-containing protein 68
LNCVEWSPVRRGTLASGGDDCQVLIWDLLNQTPSNGVAPGDNSRGPVASWQCDYEVGNLGWVPRLASQEYGEWLGVSAGRGVWGVKL